LFMCGLGIKFSTFVCYCDVGGGLIGIFLSHLKFLYC
jgi:hypothetical protein